MRTAQTARATAVVGVARAATPTASTTSPVRDLTPEEEMEAADARAWIAANPDYIQEFIAWFDARYETTYCYIPQATAAAATPENRGNQESTEAPR